MRTPDSHLLRKLAFGSGDMQKREAFQRAAAQAEGRAHERSEVAARSRDVSPYHFEWIRRTSRGAMGTSRPTAENRGDRPRVESWGQTPRGIVGTDPARGGGFVADGGGFARLAGRKRSVDS